MDRAFGALQALHNDEQGHAWAGFPALIAAIGAIALGIGAANDTGWLAITGGILAGAGILAGSVLRHRAFEYDMWRRVAKLEGK
jgi:hypothetical protein